MASGTYAANTAVDSSASRAEIERTLVRYGATSFQYGTRSGIALVGFEMKDRQIRFTLELPLRDSREFTHHSRGVRTASAAANAYEQAVRQKWRALALVVKAKLEAVESGISEFEQEFGMNIVLPDGRTVFEHAQPAIAQAYTTGHIPSLLQIEG
jgi:hypothetical protein